MAFDRSSLFATRSVQDLVDDSHDAESSLKRSIGPVGLTAMGVGAIIGTGIFVVIGEGSRPDDISRAERCLPALKECAGRALA